MKNLFEWSIFEYICYFFLYVCKLTVKFIMDIVTMFVLFM